MVPMSPLPAATESSVVPFHPAWASLKTSGQAWAAAEPALAGWLADSVLAPRSFEDALATLLISKIADSVLSEQKLKPLLLEAMAADPGIAESALEDLEAHRSRNPACPDHLTAFLFFKGYQAAQNHRVAHWFWGQDRKVLAYYLQSRGSEVFQVDIHPAAPLGRRVFIDHATGIVIGETAVIEDDVSILQNVTLGGTGKDIGKRHPTIRSGVLISTGAKVLGDIEIGRGAKIGAGSVVLDDVPEHTTVVGVPARAVGRAVEESPALAMDQHLCCQDDATG